MAVVLFCLLVGLLVGSLVCLFSYGLHLTPSGFCQVFPLLGGQVLCLVFTESLIFADIDSFAGRLFFFMIGSRCFKNVWGVVLCFVSKKTYATSSGCGHSLELPNCHCHSLD